MASKWDGKPVKFEAVNAVICCTNGNPASGSPANGNPANGRGTNGSPANGRGTNGKCTNGRGTNGKCTNGRAHEWQFYDRESVKVYLHISICVFNPIQSKECLDRTLLL
jgi:hypothetical protein